MGKPKATLHKEIKLIEQDYDEIIIDAPPRVTEIAKSIIMSADVVVI